MGIVKRHNEVIERACKGSCELAFISFGLGLAWRWTMAWRKRADYEMLCILSNWHRCLKIKGEKLGT